MKTHLILFLLITGWFLTTNCQDISKSVLKQNAPDTFQVEFTTTKGKFVIETYKNWSPDGADRLYQLITTDFFDSVAIFRVQPDYVVQFGISPDPAVNDFWERHPLEDEPVKVSNLKGRIAYAREGHLSRTTQLFINYQDNSKLDTVMFNGLRGFPPIAEVISGFEVLESFYSEYGFEPANKQDSIIKFGNAYLKKNYPKLDYILETKLINEE